MKPVIYAPVVTILKDNERIDIDGCLLLLDYLIKNDIDGVVPMGSAGEFSFFSKTQKLEFYKEYIKALDSRVDLLAGTGCYDYKDTIELSNYVLEMGIKGVLIIPEYYYLLSQYNYYDYYSLMAKNIAGNIYIYNYPARTGNNISVDTVIRLAEEHPNIVGLKDSVLDFSHTKELLRCILKYRPDFEVYTGYDNQFLDNNKYGGAGNISTIADFVPDIWAGWVKAVRENNKRQIMLGKKRIDMLMTFYSLDSNPHKLTKELLKNNGLNINSCCHFPFDTISYETIKKAIDLIDSVRILSE